MKKGSIPERRGGEKLILVACDLVSGFGFLQDSLEATSTLE
jgi:hypothetical protein